MKKIKSDLKTTNAMFNIFLEKTRDILTVLDNNESI